ncbi:MAG: class I SAM-dependent methyltransferase [Planctomycetota bacterium]
MGGSHAINRVRATLDHRLRLYESAVQQPVAEVAFLERVYAHGHGQDAWPRTLREDFAGTAAVAAAWCRTDPDREALAVESHLPTVRWATQHHNDLDTLYLVHGDAAAYHGPRVDLIAALNFSVLIWHTRDALLRYLKHARRCLRDRGVFVMDLFGGPDATAQQTQDRPALDDAGQPVTYRWEQRRYDPLTARLDCRIHFRWPDGRELRDAFTYDWRLWTVPELLDAMADAGFRKTQVWADDPRAPGRMIPVDSLPPADASPAWVIYLTAQR